MHYSDKSFKVHLRNHFLVGTLLSLTYSLLLCLSTFTFIMTNFQSKAKIFLTILIFINSFILQLENVVVYSQESRGRRSLKKYIITFWWVDRKEYFFSSGRNIFTDMCTNKKNFGLANKLLYRYACFTNITIWL